MSTSRGPAASAARSMAEVLDGRRVVICCGAGGVGKTTSAAAIAVAAAQHRGGRVLVLTVDPARRLADALGVRSVGSQAHMVPLPAGAPAGASLSFAMLDPAAGWDDLVRRQAPDAATAERIIANPLYRNVTQRFVQSHDYLAMEQLHELTVSDRYDLIVIDTPPSRHALDFLDAPDRMADFFSSRLLRWLTLPYRVGGGRVARMSQLAAKPFEQIADRILGTRFLEDIAEFFLLFQSMYEGFVERAGTVTSLLRDPATTFVVVSSLEPTPLHEAEHLAQELERRGLHLGVLLLNRVLPSLFADPGARALAIALRSLVDEGGPEGADAAQRRVLGGAADTFTGFSALVDHEEAQRRRLATRPEAVLSVPMLDHEITDLDGLSLLGSMLWEPVPSTPSRARSRSTGGTTRRSTR